MPDSMTDPAALVTSGYDRLGWRYSDWSAGIEQPLRDELLDRALDGLDREAVVAELGCGTGVPVARHTAPRLRYLGIDRSPEMLRLAGRNAPGARLVRADMATVALRPGSLDAVVAFYSLIHVPRRHHSLVFRSVASWLRPGGRFVASLGAHDLPAKVHPDWLGEVPMYWSFFDAATNLRLLVDAGLTVEWSTVAVQIEDGKEVPFLWVLARRE